MIAINKPKTKQEKCLIADFMVVFIIKDINKKATALGQTPKYNRPFFTSMEIGKRASSFIKESSKFKNYTIPVIRYIST